MKHTILSILALAGAMVANAATVNLGYCSGQAGTPSWRGYADAWQSMAIHIPASTANAYAGATIKAIRGYLSGNDRVSKIKVWVKNDLAAEPLAQKEQSKSSLRPFNKGWAEVKLSGGGYVIPDDNPNGLYIGFSPLMSDDGYVVNAVPEATTGGYWIETQAFGWRDNGYANSLCIEAVVEGDNLPQTDIMLLNPEKQPPYVMTRGTLRVQGQALNLGAAGIEGYDLVMRLDGQEVARQHMAESLASMQRMNYDVTVTPAIDAVGPHELTVEAEVTGDADLADNALTSPMDVVAEEYTRMPLLEEFTTEWCGNCPEVTEMIHRNLNSDKYAGRVAFVAHHSGYKTDTLTTSWDEELLALFGGGSYCPGTCIDRYEFSTKDRAVVGNYIEAEERFCSNLDTRLNWPAVVNLDLAAYEQGDMMHVDVNLTKCVETLCDNPAITVYVIEDGVKAIDQAGAFGEYYHNGVNRATNSTWGDPIEFQGNECSYSCDLAIPAEVNRDNMRVVAFVSDNAKSYLRRTVMNAAETKATPVAIEQLTAPTGSAKAVYYDLMGRRVSAPTHGVYVKVTDGHAQKIEI